MGYLNSYAYFLPIHSLYQIVSIQLCHDIILEKQLLYVGYFLYLRRITLCAFLQRRKSALPGVYAPTEDFAGGPPYKQACACQ